MQVSSRCWRRQCLATVTSCWRSASAVICAAACTPLIKIKTPACLHPWTILWPSVLLRFALTAGPGATLWDQCSLGDLTAVCGACRRL